MKEGCEEYREFDGDSVVWSSPGSTFLLRNREELARSLEMNEDVEGLGFARDLDIKEGLGEVVESTDD